MSDDPSPRVGGTTGRPSARRGSHFVSGRKRPSCTLVLTVIIGPAPGVLLGVAAALTVGLVGTAWERFSLARSYLASRGEVPRNPMAFLADAHEHRGVLRQVGVVYQFRPLDMHRQLAREDSEAR
ncbi:hypothetical protein [Streptomyces sp. NPDC005017]|uniref:hypothetical protein n=1 Tax=Streptomyces sp. NPDC005017 TaxID=3364706 RepID=UPI0036C53AED